ncbi:MAG TPA: plastocyanin/azurin family copper-binding protein [Tepidisphaeraceae bacterium]|nr:plastocyanin/azurin family copper-binding protein [Tepidisphaeraceae bacterium]
MKKMNRYRVLCAAVALGLGVSAAAPVRAADEEAPAGPPRIMLDKSPAVVAYQLKRLTNAQLAAAERKADHAKYKPVYQAILVRKGMDKKLREEAVEALVAIDRSEPVAVLLAGIGKVDAEDKATPRELASLLLAQKPAALAAKGDELRAMATESDNPAVKQAAWAALIVGDHGHAKAWRLATGRGADGIKPMLAAVSLVPSAALRKGTYDDVVAQTACGDESVEAAALEALGYVSGREADAFGVLAKAVSGATGEKRAAAVRAIGRIPASKWPKDGVEPLAQAVVKLVESTPTEQRTTPEVVQAVQLGNDLAGAMGQPAGPAVRKRLRELAVRVVLMRTLVEQMQYDLRYFTVQAGKPVQIVLQNDDNMPHNLVITAPGGLAEIGTKGGSMAAPDDPKVKAHVPDDPKVLHATHMINNGETTTLSFNAPDKPGNYPFLCTYPAHWVRMYGVMQVVADLDAYDANPVVPKDPMTRKPYDNPKNEVVEGAAGGHGAEHKH